MWTGRHSLTSAVRGGHGSEVWGGGGSGAPKAGSGHPSPGSGVAAGGCGSAGPARARRRQTTAARWRLSVAHPGAEAVDAWGGGGVAGPCAEAAGAWGNGGVASPCADAARQRPLNAATTPPLTRSPRPASGSPRRSDRGSPVREQPLGSVGRLPRQPGLGGGLASVAEQPGCQRGGQVKCGGRTMGAPVRSGSATGGQMAVQRELAAVCRLSCYQSAPSSFLELIFFFAGSWIEAAARQQGKLRLPKQCHLVPGSPSAKTSEAAGRWWNGGVLRQLSGTVVQRSRLTEGHRCGPKRKPSLVVHRTGGGYAFGRRNLIGALSRLPSLFLDEHLWVNHFLDRRWRHSGCRDHCGGIVFRNLVSVKWDPSRSWGTVGPTKTNKIYIFKLAQCNKKIFTWQREPLTCRVPWTRGYPKHSGHAGTRLGCLDSRGPRQGHEHTLSTGLSWETRTRCVANSTKVVFDCVGWNLGTLP
uniref:Uncharacterized protein n=1 Tax=Oryza nivara TaxID=4536 RepID=A0A0E0HGY6_ORYNI